MHKALSPISKMFTIAAAFGNVHGVYKAGNVVLNPKLLGEFQEYGKKQLGTSPIGFRSPLMDPSGRGAGRLMDGRRPRADRRRLTN